MLSSAQNTDICIRFDVCCSASGYVYGTHCSTCAPISTTLSAEHVVKSVFWAEWENSPPEVSAISSAYVYQWLMTAPLHWQRRQQQKHQKDRQKKGGGEIWKKRRKQKATYCTSELELWLIALENLRQGGGKTCACEWEQEKATERKGKKREAK